MYFDRNYSQALALSAARQSICVAIQAHV